MSSRRRECGHGTQDKRADGLGAAALGYWLNHRFKVRHDVAGPSTMIGASIFFELAVAIVLYGFDSGAAPATVVGVPIDVPVML